MEEDVGMGGRSGGSRQRRYSEEFKRDAVALWRRSGKSIAEVARELGVNDMSLGLWIKKSDDVSPVGEDDKAGQAEAARLRKRVKELEEEIDILKRFTAYWVKDSSR
jgi:transposase